MGWGTPGQYKHPTCVQQNLAMVQQQHVTVWWTTFQHSTATCNSVMNDLPTYNNPWCLSSGKQSIQVWWSWSVMNDAYTEESQPLSNYTVQLSCRCPELPSFLCIDKFATSVTKCRPSFYHLITVNLLKELMSKLSPESQASYFNPTFTAAKCHRISVHAMSFKPYCILQAPSPRLNLF